MPVQILPTPSQPDWGAQFMGGFQQGMAIPEKLQNLKKGRMEMEAMGLEQQYKRQIMDELTAESARAGTRFTQEQAKYPLELRQLNAAIKLAEWEATEGIDMRVKESGQRIEESKAGIAARGEEAALAKQRQANEAKRLMLEEKKALQDIENDMWRIYTETGYFLPELAKKFLGPVVGKFVGEYTAARMGWDAMFGPSKSKLEREKALTDIQAGKQAIKESEAATALSKEKMRLAGQPSQPTFNEENAAKRLLYEAAGAVAAGPPLQAGKNRVFRPDIPEIKREFHIDKDVGINVLRRLPSDLPTFVAMTPKEQAAVLSAMDVLRRASPAQQKTVINSLPINIATAIRELRALEKAARRDAPFYMASGKARLGAMQPGGTPLLEEEE